MAPIYVLFAFTSTAMSQAAVSHAPQLDAFAQKLLGVSDTQTAVWAKGARQGLIEVAPVNLPVNPPGDCNHYGWPVATMTKDTLIVMHRRIPGHRAKARPLGFWKLVWRGRSIP